MKLSTTDIAATLGVSRQSINKRSKKEQWACLRQKAKGGGKIYDVAALPRDIQDKIMAAKQEEIVAVLPEKAAPPVVAELLPSPPVKRHLVATSPQPMRRVSGSQRSKAMAKFELTRVYTGFLSEAGSCRKMAARDEFITRYLSGEWPLLLERVGAVAWKTIEGWKVTLTSQNGDPLSLLDTRGGSTRGMQVLTPEQMRILRCFAFHPNKMRISHAIKWARRVMAQHGINTVSAATCRRYLNSLKVNDYPSWVFYREGEQELENKCGYTIERDWNKVDVGDLLTADGHVMNFTVINPLTGKPCRPTLVLWFDTRSNMPLGWELMPSENTQSIHVALRRAIITLGKIPKVAYLDNGRAFRGKYFTQSPDFENGEIAGLYGRLGIGVSFATPYHGQAKTVERFFGTMLEMETIMPTYVGNSIAAKPARMNRGESLHRKLWKKYGMGENAISMLQAHEFIATWFDEYARENQRGHLDGACPLEVFNAGKGPGVDKELLTELMMSVRLANIRKEGIRMFGQTYYHPALYGRRKPVVVRYDITDQGCIYVYDQESGSMLCTAEPKVRTHPSARLLGDDSERDTLKAEMANKNRIKTQTVGPAREALAKQVLPEFKQFSHDLGILSSRNPVPGKKGHEEKVLSFAHTPRPALEEAAPEPIDHEQMQRELAEGRRLTEEMQKRDFRARLEQLSDADRYEELIELYCKGSQLDDDFLNFMRMFEETPEYQRFEEYWDGKWMYFRRRSSGEDHERSAQAS